MHYRTNANPHRGNKPESAPKLTWRQWLTLQYFNCMRSKFSSVSELSQEKWYREYMGGIWSKAAHGVWKHHFIRVSVCVENNTHTIAEPAIGGIDPNDFYWVQAPATVTRCIHEDKRRWLTATHNMFSERYGKFTDMSMVHRMLASIEDTVLVAPLCDCEKYQHRRKEAEQ